MRCRVGARDGSQRKYSETVLVPVTPQRVISNLVIDEPGLSGNDAGRFAQSPINPHHRQSRAHAIYGKSFYRLQ
jgi:hypothetical protein